MFDPTTNTASIDTSEIIQENRTIAVNTSELGRFKVRRARGSLDKAKLDLAGLDGLARQKSHPGDQLKELVRRFCWTESRYYFIG